MAVGLYFSLFLLLTQWGESRDKAIFNAKQVCSSPRAPGGWGVGGQYAAALSRRGPVHPPRQFIHIREEHETKHPRLLSSAGQDAEPPLSLIFIPKKPEHS